MKNLQNLSDENLLQITQSLVKREREITIEIIEHLSEVERRRLFAARGFSSLFEYCVKSLGYSESAAYRRIQALRALKDSPQIKEKIISSELSLSVVADAQKFFKAENITQAPAKQAVFEVLAGKSAREAQKELAQRATQPQMLTSGDRAKAVAADLFEFKTLVDQAFLNKLQELKGRFAHQRLSTNEILNQMADALLKASDPAREPRVKARAVARKQSSTASSNAAKLNPDCKPKPCVADQQKTATSVLHPVASQVTEFDATTCGLQAGSQKNRYIPAAMRREVWRRDSGQCTFVDPLTKRRCESRFALQIDHIEAVAFGGKSEPSNLRLLCACHNQFHAIKSFGLESMRPYLKS